MVTNGGSQPPASPERLPRESLLEIVATAPIVMTVKDLTGRYVYMNPHAAALLSVEPQARLGWSAHHLFGEQVAEQLSADDREVAASGQAQEFEETLILPDGPHAFLSLKFPVHDAVGAVSGVALIATDITERARLAVELRESEQRLQYVLAQAPVYLAVSDAEGKMTFLGGPRFEELGIDPASLLGGSFEIMTDAPALSDHLRRALGGETVVGDIERFGMILEQHAGPIHDASGQPAGAIGVSFDVTERRLTERELAAANDHLNYLVSASPVVIGESDQSGDPVVYVSPNIDRLFGYRPEEVVGEPGWLRKHVHPDDRRLAQNMLDEAIHNLEGDASAEVRFLHGDGAYRWVIVRTGVITEADGIPGKMLWCATDITDRVEAQERARLAEERRRRTERLETIGQLAGGVAHDFNNLLAVILANAEFVGRELPAGLPPDLAEQCEAVRHYAAEIEQAATRGAELTRQLLAFGRSDQIEPQVVHLGVLLADLELILRRSLGELVGLAVHAPAGLWSVVADPGQIEQILLNLAANGRDAMPEGGPLVITLENVELDEAGTQPHPDLLPGRYVCIAVTDAGTGMAPEVAARAVEPFFTTKARGKGTGLGLATVDGIVRRIGGQIMIHSEPGRGTNVKVYLPAAAAAAAAASPVASPVPHPTGGETVLLIDDDSAVREAARGIMSRHGYAVLTAPDPAAAVALCADSDTRIDLLLTDVVMPGMNGVELADQVRALRPALPVLFMSGYPADVPGLDRIRISDRLLPKPFTSDRLLRMVGELLDASPKGKR